MKVFFSISSCRKKTRIPVWKFKKISAEPDLVRNLPNLFSFCLGQLNAFSSLIKVILDNPVHHCVLMIPSRSNCQLANTPEHVRRKDPSEKSA